MDIRGIKDFKVFKVLNVPDAGDILSHERPNMRLLRTIFVHAGAKSSKKDYYLCKLELLQTNLWQRTIKTIISKSTN